MLSLFCKKSPRTCLAGKSSTPQARLGVEVLESRLVPYALSGSAWTRPELITIGFVPDGTDLGGVRSNLVSSFNSRFASESAWQNAVLKAAQVWAQQTNMNLAVVADNGAAIGSGAYQQGDPLMADIRIGGFNFGSTTLARAYLPPSANNFSIAGDIQFNTAQTWVMNTTGGYDLFTVAMHEFGHAFGLLHSSSYTSAMYGAYAGTRSGLGIDDVSGIRANYGGGLLGRTQDLFDTVLPNNTLATASFLDSIINPTTLTALVTDLDITTALDVDYWTFAAPAGTTGTLQVKVQSQGLSMLEGSFGLYNQSRQMVGFATGAGQHGSTQTMTVNGVKAGQRFYLAALSADPLSPFGTGKYAVTLNFGSSDAPIVPLPDTRTAIGNPLSSKGGSPVEEGVEFAVNVVTEGIQTTNRDAAGQAVARDAAGNTVITWTSQENGTEKVYAQLYDSRHQTLGGAFGVSTTTAGEQRQPTVARAANGDFVIVWTSGLVGQSGAVYGQRYAADGAPVGSEFLITHEAEWELAKPSVAMAADGRFVVAWSSRGQDGGVLARQYSVQGQPEGNVFRVNQSRTGDQRDATVAMDADGNFVVVWSSYGQRGDGWGVYARRYDWLGTPLSGEVAVNTTTVDDQSRAAVAMGPDNSFVVAWTSTGPAGADVRARLFGGTLLTGGSEIQVSSAMLAGEQRSLAVAMDRNGHFVVAWSGNVDGGSGWDVWARHFNPEGQAHANEFVVSRYSAGDQTAPSVAMDGAGNFVVVWSGQGPGDNAGVFAQGYEVHFPDQEGGIGDLFLPQGCGHLHDLLHALLPGEGCCCPTCGVALGDVENSIGTVLPQVADAYIAADSWASSLTDSIQELEVLSLRKPRRTSLQNVPG